MTDPMVPGDRLTSAEKLFLRELAITAVSAAVTGQEPPKGDRLAQQAGLSIEPRLSAQRGVFVTLHLDGHLRGCIGHIVGHQPLLAAIVRNGQAAACEDPRFPPVAPAEIPHLTWEISVLTPLRPVADTAEIELGRHGILLTKGNHQSVFLPQVAPEQGWDLEATLTHLALKAGLAADEWRKETEFQVFEADVF